MGDPVQNDDPAVLATLASRETDGDGAALEFLENSPAEPQPGLIARWDEWLRRAPTPDLSGRVVRKDVPRVALFVAVVVWLRVFIPLAVDQHRNYFTWDFDLGIFDQATWLLSHGRGFITVRGLEVLGHHLNFGLLLFAPAYWLGAGPEFLNVMMALALAASVIPIVLICRHYRPGNDWYGLAFSFAFLFGAIPQSMMVESFNPEKMAIPFMLLALWAALGRRWRLFALFLVLTLCWKEDLALFGLMLGLGVAWKRDRRIGLITAGASLAYFVVGTRFVLPHYSGTAFYADFLGPLGSTPTEVASNFVRHPKLFADKYNQNDGAGYVIRLQQPWLFTGFLSPASLLLALPSYLVNVLSSQGYTQDVLKHYVTVPFVASSFSAFRGTLSRHTGRIRIALAVGIVAMTIWTLPGGTGPWGDRYATGIWGLNHTSKVDVLDRAVALVPDDASVAASYMIVPHLTRRPEVYSFPNPWIAQNWAIHDENPRDPHRVDWVVLDEGLEPDAKTAELIAKLHDSPCWETALDESDVAVFHRTATTCDV